MALVVRLLVSSQLSSVAFVRTPKLDAFEYIEWARAILAGAGAWPAIPAHGPGYPYLLAGALRLVGGSLRAAYGLQAVLGSVSCLLVASLAWRLTGSRVTAILAGLIQAAYGPAVVVETTLLPEGLMVFLLLTELILLLQLRATWLKALLTGATLGLAALVRPTALAFLPVMLVHLALECRRPSQRLVAPALALLICVATVSPTVWQNWRTSGYPGIQAYFGLNFYIGNTPGASGTPWARFGSGWDRIEGEAFRAGRATPSEQDTYYLTKTLREIRDQPSGYLKLLASKILWVVQAEEIRDSHSFWFFQSQSPLLACLLTFGLVFPFAAIGLVVAWQRRDIVHGQGALIGYVIAMSVTCVALVVGFRYRLPITPVLNVYAAVGVIGLWQAVSEEKPRRAIALLAAGVMAFGLSHVRGHRPSHNFAEEWAFVGSALITERDLAGAEGAYQRALQIDSSNGYAWDGLGLVYFNSARWNDARRAFEKAGAIDPDDARVHYHLGLIARQTGDLDRGITEMRRSLELVPERQEVMRSLASVLIDAQRLGEAVIVLRRLTILESRDAVAHLALARAEALTGDLTAAFQALAVASQLEPDDRLVRLTTIMMQLLARNLEAGRAAIDRYAQRASVSPQLELLTALLNRLEGREPDADRILRKVGERDPALWPAVRFLLSGTTSQERIVASDAFLRRALAEPVFRF